MNGRTYFSWVDTNTVYGVPYDFPIVGYDGKSVNYLILFSAKTDDELDIKILKLNTEEKNQLLNSLETLPVYYFNEDAVNKMLFLMANKRADTIKELVNLYEEIQWQNKLINGLADISLNIKDLVRDLNENFQSLGRQLKCINDNVLDAKVVVSDSVNEMRNAILINAASNILNAKVLSQIKDDNAKHYLEMSNNINRLSCYLSFPTKDRTETHDHLY